MRCAGPGSTRALSALLLAMACGAAAAQGAKGRPLPRADFHPACPFTVAPPSVVAVLDAARWRKVLAAARSAPAPYDAAATDFRRESVFIVALPHMPATVSDASLSARRPEKFDAATGTLTMWFDVDAQPMRPGDVGANAIGQPCLVVWTEARKDLQQVVMRLADGRYIAGARTAEKPKKTKR
jgi:hypothetical protein